MVPHAPRQWSIANKLTLIVVLFAISLSVLGLLACGVLNPVKVNAKIYQDVILQKDLVADILPPPEYLIETYLTALQLATESDPAARRGLIDKCASLRHDFDDRHSYWSTALPPGALRDALVVKSSEPALEVFSLIEKELMPAVNTGELQKALSTVKGPILTAYAKHRAAIDETVNLANQMSTDIQTGAAANVRASSLIILGTALGFLVLVTGVTVKISLGINRSLSEISGSIHNGANQLTTAATQLSTSSQNLAQCANEQAASLQETGAALQEMASMTKQSAESAKQANGISDAARQSLSTGDQAMRRMAEAIAQIENSATQTANIIKTIDEIAFQTNLLALNAAVEAARAGESGKGFAVVAEEVRTLAMRSAKAATNTSELISGSVRNSQNGVTIAADVDKALSDIKESFTQVNRLISEIAGATGTQSQGIEQVNVAVNQIDQATQSAAANAQQNAAASEEVKSQAVQLRFAVERLSHMLGRRTVEPQTAEARGMSFN